MKLYFVLFFIHMRNALFDGSEDGVKTVSHLSDASVTFCNMEKEGAVYHIPDEILLVYGMTRCTVMTLCYLVCITYIT